MNGFCIVSFALLGSSIATMFMHKKYIQDFDKSLDSSQKKIYKDIRKERLNIFIMSSIFAFVVGGYISLNNSCLGTAVGLFLQMMIYLIWPKSKYMLDNMKKPEQSSLWLKKYKHMSLLGYIGTFVGVVIYLLQYYAK